MGEEMAIVTADDYRERLYRMRKNIYMGGELIGRDDPRLKPGVDLIADSFERVKDPNLKDTITAKSHLSLIHILAGFSAYWVELGKPIQDELIARTEYAAC